MTEYKFLRGSDINRDGMYLELSVAGESPLAEVFYSDTSAEFYVTCYAQDIPLNALEELIQRARRDLPSVS
ncbi:hypothetical protein ACFPN1_00005 [Lysobacter yangpyeongensis]|uniref:Uncharacterized protein n=1 Tax=Lysobacter yangpyeongensis TaxID=346182 RepID=A0ABW0SHN5_9GAMM